MVVRQVCSFMNLCFVQAKMILMQILVNEKHFFLLKNILSARKSSSCNLPDWWLGSWRLSCSQEVMWLTLSFSLLAYSPCASRYSWAASASSRSNFQIVCSQEHEQESVICPKIWRFVSHLRASEEVGTLS